MNKDEIVTQWYKILDSYLERKADIRDNYKHELYTALLDDINEVLNDSVMQLLGMDKMKELGLIRQMVESESNEVQTMLYRERYVNINHWENNGNDAVIYYIKNGVPIRERFYNDSKGLSDRFEELVFVKDKTKRYNSGWVKYVPKEERRKILIDRV
jgi:hypothetical protein